MQDGQYIIGLDVGTTQIRVVVGYVDPSAPTPNVVGVGAAKNNGMRKGIVVNIVNTAQAIDKALEAAERMSGHEIHAATVNVNGAHVTGMTSKGVVAVGSGGHEITEEDLARVEEAATVVQLPANREILQVTPRSYQLDGNENIKDPLGMHGIRLEVDAHVITALAPHIHNLEKAVEMTHTASHRIAVSSLAAARAVLSEQQVENGVALIDFGGTTINLAVFEEGDLQHVAVLPVGSVNITNDLAIGLRTDLDIAEQVKLQYATGAAREGKDAMKTVSVTHEGEKLQFDAEEVDMIISARLDEIFEMIDDELRSIQRAGKLPGGVVLVGGGANLKGVTSIAKERLRMSARIAKMDKFQDVSGTVHKPEFATALGLMLLDIDMVMGQDAQAKGSKKTGGSGSMQQAGVTAKKVFGGISSLIKKLKP
ncbi:MAG TPA: cell division protein FtsA [Candidatus Saccharimonadales bacterium]